MQPRGNSFAIASRDAAVGHQLGAHSIARRSAVAPVEPLQDPGQVLHVVAVLVGQHVRLGERPAIGAEAGPQLVEELEVKVDRLVVRAVERPDG